MTASARAVGQIPIYYNHENTGRPGDPNNKYTSKYLDLSADHRASSDDLGSIRDIRRSQQR